MPRVEHTVTPNPCHHAHTPHLLHPHPRSRSPRMTAGMAAAQRRAATSPSPTLLSSSSGRRSSCPRCQSLWITARCWQSCDAGRRSCRRRAGMCRRRGRRRTRRARPTRSSWARRTRRQTRRAGTASAGSGAGQAVYWADATLYPAVGTCWLPRARAPEHRLAARRQAVHALMSRRAWHAGRRPCALATARHLSSSCPQHSVPAHCCAPPRGGLQGGAWCGACPHVAAAAARAHREHRGERFLPARAVTPLTAWRANQKTAAAQRLRAANAHSCWTMRAASLLLSRAPRCLQRAVLSAAATGGVPSGARRRDHDAGGHTGIPGRRAGERAWCVPA